MLHGLKNIRFGTYPIELLKDVVLFGDYKQHLLLNRLILELNFKHHKRKDTEQRKYILVTCPNSFYSNIYSKDCLFISDSLDKYEFERFIKNGEYDNIIGKYTIEKAYLYNPKCDYNECMDIINEIFKN